MKIRPTQPRRRLEGYHPPLQVARFIATRSGDAERGPKIWMRPAEAQLRLLAPGELVWVFGPHRHELVELELDAEIPRGYIVARDVAGIATAEVVRVVKPDFDNTGGPARA